MSTKTKEKKKSDPLAPYLKKDNPFYRGHIKIPRISKRAFDKMTPAQKRVTIAKDVLARIRAGKIIDTHGIYFSIPDERLSANVRRYDWDSDSYSVEAKILQKASAQKLVESMACEACAKGACFISWIANFNERTINEMRLWEGTLPKEFKGIFPYTIWSAIESAYEGYDGRGDKTLGWVMENLIKHEGNFKTSNGTLLTD